MENNGWALVTGGSRGLGYESARGLANRGFNVGLLARDPQRLRDAKESLTSEFPQNSFETFAVDLETLTPSHEIFNEIKNEIGTPQTLILAHGVMSEKMSKTLRTSLQEWRRVMSINLDSVFTLVNAIVPSMVEARNGRVIIYSACLGRMSGPGNTGGLAPYRVSKSGVNALVRNLAHETGLGARGILVDAVCPNHSQTDMGGPDAPRSAQEGAATAIWLATRDFDARSEHPDVTGVLWEDQEVIPW
ncbi:unannotated protein [freshwater metagenome]|uniref:Unannotated protein n=1 Tax=freshwater metagenome TaxID=449393 RepID=A0A6J7XVU7_9ZZZZ|nr:SDR family NAD(P)-dependent oxidoreductase [Actinomycetota bacterium]